jgi:hypothetical protein
MATVYPIDRAYRITPQDHGNFAEFGPAGVASAVGTWGFSWVPDGSFAGGLAVMARASGQKAKDNDTPFKPYPYQGVTVNGVLSSPAFGYVTTTITGPSDWQVPSNGMSIALLINCTAGFGWLYSWDLNGTANAP